MSDCADCERESYNFTIFFFQNYFSNREVDEICKGVFEQMSLNIEKVSKLTQHEINQTLIYDKLS